MQKSGPRRVAVTGYGAVCSLGNNVDEIWNSISNYKVGYQREEFEGPNVVAKFFGFMHNKPPSKKIPKAILKFLPEHARLGMLAADEAVSMAFGPDSNFGDFYDPFERGVIFGTGWAAQDESTVETKSYHDTGLAAPLSNLLVMPNVGTAAISIRWNLRGYQNTAIAACATGSIAIGDAYEIIRSGRAKVMLAGGSESITQGFFAIELLLQKLSK
jgi:3-oxoacyl-[acyl-carrier-protein] synthase II